MSEDSHNIIQLVMDSEGKLFGLFGDKMSHAACPVGFAPSEDLVLAVKLALLQEANRGRHDAVLFQLALENLETAWANLLDLLK